MHRSSRAGDPHRHVHMQWGTRVFAEGQWRGLHTAPPVSLRRPWNRPHEPSRPADLNCDRLHPAAGGAPIAWKRYN
ncbi:relaxase domain-containing protein [Microbacterium sp. SL62]|nr:relaxase domain-containing protein [Microbacterium sp. SL62]